MRKKVWAAYFSPTGGTKKAALNLACNLGEEVEELNLSVPGLLEKTFGPEELVVVAAPVFGGRIPGLMAERLRRLKGQNTAAVMVAVYGNRAFEDALVELNDILREQGFVAAAGVAALAEHSMVREVAAGRPDKEDEAQMAEFGLAILKKLDGGAVLEAQIPGNRPYKEWKKMPAAPAALDACTGCGLCAAECPAEAISQENPKQVDVDKCILCLRCVVVCPNQARRLPPQVQEMLNAKLSPLKGIRRENELFL